MAGLEWKKEYYRDKEANDYKGPQRVSRERQCKG